MSPRMTDGLGRFPRGLLSNAAEPRTLDEALAQRATPFPGQGKVFAESNPDSDWYRRADFMVPPGSGIYLPPDGPLDYNSEEGKRRVDERLAADWPAFDCVDAEHLSAVGHVGMRDFLLAHLPPPRWRWYRDAAVWGFIFGCGLLALGLIYLAGY